MYRNLVGLSCRVQQPQTEAEASEEVNQDASSETKQPEADSVGKDSAPGAAEEGPCGPGFEVAAAISPEVQARLALSMHDEQSVILNLRLPGETLRSRTVDAFTVHQPFADFTAGHLSGKARSHLIEVATICRSRRRVQLPPLC